MVTLFPINGYLIPEFACELLLIKECAIGADKSSTCWPITAIIAHSVHLHHTQMLHLNCNRISWRDCVTILLTNRQDSRHYRRQDPKNDNPCPMSMLFICKNKCISNLCHHKWAKMFAKTGRHEEYRKCTLSHNRGYMDLYERPKLCPFYACKAKKIWSLKGGLDATVGC
jgi:hypothetical protein